MHEHATLAVRRRPNASSAGNGPATAQSRPPPALPAKPEQTERQNCKARRGANSRPYCGVQKSRKKVPSRLWAHRTRIKTWSAKWGRSAGARCETRWRRMLAACSRRIGRTTESRSPPLAATLKNGVRHAMEKAEAHGGSLRVHGGHGTAGGCTTHVVRGACVVHRSGPVCRPGWTRGAFVWQPLVWSVTRGPCRLLAEAASAHLVGVSRCQLLRMPKQWPIGATGGRWGRKNAA
jgi:hypothetical protein